MASKFHVISARDLLALGRMVRHQDVRDQVHWLDAGQLPLALIFMSHRWETLAHPDPTGRQHKAIQHLLRAICVCFEALLVDREDRLALVPSLEQEGYVQAEEIARRALGFGPFSDSRQCIGGKEARKFLEDGFALRRASKGAFRDWVAGMIGVWVDYTCMPQQPFAPEDELEFRQALRELDVLVESSTVVALRNADDDYSVRGWCASEFFLGSAQSFSKGLYVDMERLANAKPVAILRPPSQASSATPEAKVMMESYENDLAAWRGALERWSLSEGPLIREHAPDLWGSYRDLQGSAFSATDADPNPFRRVLDAISSLETSLVEKWLMSERPRTIDVGKTVYQLMQRHGMRCAKNSDLVYLGYVVACHGWIDAFRPLFRECLRRHVEEVVLSGHDENGSWPSLLVTLTPLGEKMRGLFFAIRPSSAAVWYSRLKSQGAGDHRERDVIFQIRAGLANEAPGFTFVGPTGRPYADDVEDFE